MRLRCLSVADDLSADDMGNSERNGSRTVLLYYGHGRWDGGVIVVLWDCAWE